MTSDLPPTGGAQPPSESPAGPEGPAQPGPTGSWGPAGSAPTAPPSAPYAGPTGPTGHGTGHGSGHGTGSGKGHGTDDFFNRIRSAGVTRPDEGRWIAGVAEGLARRWDIDPIFVRGVFVALGIFGGIGVALYGLAWLFLPQEDGRIHLQQAFRGHFSAGFVGAVLLSLAAIGRGGGITSVHNGYWFGWGFPGGLILTAVVIFGIWWLAKNWDSGSGRPPGSGSGWSPGSTGSTAGPATGSTAGPSSYSLPPVYGTPTTSPTSSLDYPGTGSTAGDWTADPRTENEASREARRAEKTQAQLARAAEAEEAARATKARRARIAPSKTIVRLSLGIALLTAAAILVIGNANDWSEPVGLIAAASALAVIAVGVIVSGLSGRRAAGLAGIGVLLAAAVLAGAGAENAGVRPDQHLALIGSRNWEPDSAREAESQFNLGVGEATLWLTDPAILRTASAGDPLDVRARVGAGHLIVVLPDGVSTRVDLAVAAGEVTYPDGTTAQFDRQNGSRQQRVSFGPAGPPRMIVDIQVGAGQLEIQTSTGNAVTTTPSPSAVKPAPTATASPRSAVTASPTASN